MHAKRSSFLGVLWYSVWHYWILRLNAGSNMSHDVLKTAYINWKKNYEYDRLDAEQKARYSSYTEITLPDIDEIEGWMLAVYPLIFVISALVLFILIGTCVTTIGYAFMRFNPGALNDPNRQIFVPTVTPQSDASEIPFEPKKFWYDEVSWLTIVEANELRQKENVANLALLESNGTWYARDLTVNFDASSGLWEKTHPFIVTQLGVDGTSLFVTVNGNSYYLNVYQPFVDVVQPNLLMLVDVEGNLWAADFDSVELVSLADANTTINIDINKNLSPTYINR